MSDYYTVSGNPTTGSSGSSATMRSEFSLISAAFDKLPGMNGNGSRAVIVNSGGTALTLTTGALALAGNFQTTGAFSLNFNVTNNTSVVLPTSGTLVSTASNLSVFAATTSAQLAGIISDETGSGPLVFANSPTINTPTLNTPTLNTPTLITPTLGVATATSINGLNVATTAGGGLSVANNKTLTVSNSVTIAGTDATTLTFQGTDTYVGRATTDTLTNKRVTWRVNSMADGASITPNGDTTDEATHSNTQPAGNLAVNSPSGTPTDGQRLVMRLKSSNAQTYNFNAVYRGSADVPLPTTLTGNNKTDYLGFLYNSTDTKWDLVALVRGYT